MGWGDGVGVICGKSMVDDCKLYYANEDELVADKDIDMQVLITWCIRCSCGLLSAQAITNSQSKLKN